MTKPKIVLVAACFISVLILVVIFYVFNLVNNTIEKNNSKEMHFFSESVTPNKFISQVKAGKLTTEDYVKLFELDFEHHKANVATASALMSFNTEIKELLALLVVLQFILLSLYIKLSSKT